MLTVSARLSVSSRRLMAMTLMELLIAIGLVAIVALLMLPAVGIARHFSDSTKCVYHLRQTGSAILAYAGDRHGKILPRYASDVPDKEAKGWTKRLVTLGYVTDPSILLCPSFFPKKLSESNKHPGTTDASEAYGMRMWVAPSEPWGEGNKHKPLAQISNPASFFLLADSIWLNWESQGYGITPGSANQAIHLRHKNRANALFLDGHVEAKNAEYFEEISNKQTQYTGDRVLKLKMVTDTNSPAP